MRYVDTYRCVTSKNRNKQYANAAIEQIKPTTTPQFGG